MSYRGSQIYVKPETRRLLSLIAMSRGRNESADELGDTMLLESIITKYPQLAQYLEKIEELEQQIIEEIRK